MPWQWRHKHTHNTNRFHYYNKNNSSTYSVTASLSRWPKSPRPAIKRKYSTPYTTVRNDIHSLWNDLIKNRVIGVVICVRCENAATRNYLGGRCSGHGVPGRITRWTSLTNVECHGKWLRRPDESPEASSQQLCSCNEDALMIFV